MLADRMPAASSAAGRRVCLALTILVTAIAVLFWPASPAQAAPTNQCGYKEWVQNPRGCLDKLPKPGPIDDATRACMGIPTLGTPDSGFGGWFASDPHIKPGKAGRYSVYGYSGYTYPIYNPGCAQGNSPVPNDVSATTTIANGELTVATGIVGAANAFRERAYNPSSMWGWSDGLVKTATKAVYQKVFSVFGVVTIAIVGMYLLWRSRQANMSDALTTAGWAVMVMLVVTAVAAWPLVSAHLADSTLINSLALVHSAVGPQPKDTPLNKCINAMPNPPAGTKHDPSLCKDHRSAAVIASDTATESILYDNWLRGTLGSSTSDSAKMYGPSLYRASSLSWEEAREIQQDPTHEQRTKIYAQKEEDFRKLAELIRTDDPDAYSYLTGHQTSARIGSGLIAIISALAFSFFDIAASLLIILGFLIFRWAVVAIPVIGTIAILRPASAGFKRLINIVIAAVFNIVIFGAGASIYLFAVDLIMNTASLPGWLQITLVWLCGIVGWLLLRPFRRITQLGGKSPVGEIANIGSWHKRFFSDLKGVAIGAAGAAAMGDIEAQDKDEPKKRRADQTKDSVSPAGTDGPLTTDTPPPNADDTTPTSAPRPDPAERPVPDRPQRRTPAPAAGDDRVWVPATGRYADGSDDRNDLSSTVGREPSYEVETRPLPSERSGV